ncbi:MAG: DUF4271 domain-containing protein [Candidatus Competibacteraceae bacterium]|nr:DUF4271 domain-containing protein [Candidatus Competibacteraceae bacterium]
MPQHIVIYSPPQRPVLPPVGYTSTYLPEWKSVDTLPLAHHEWLYFHMDSAMAKLQQSVYLNSVQPSYISSIFSLSPHTVQFISPQPILKDSIALPLLNIWLLLSLGTFAFIRVNRFSQTLQWLSGAFRFSRLMRFLEEYQPGLRPPFFSVYLLSILLISATFFTVISTFTSITEENMPEAAAIIFIAVFILPFIRNFFIAIWGWIFREGVQAKMHVQISYLGLIGYAIYLFPFFLNNVLQFGLNSFFNVNYLLAGGCALVLYQAFRLFQLEKIGGGLSFLYMLLYFCTLEIAPLLLIAVSVSKY